jgi:hypothetical protein
MALSIPLDTPFGIRLESAYVKIAQIQIISKNSFNLEVHFYASQPKEVSLQPIFVKNSFIAFYDLNGPNPIKQAYLHLKSLPEFADAVDC